MHSIITPLRKWLLISATVGCTILTSCDDDDPPLADNVVQFESEEVGLGADEQDLTINLNLTREATVDSDITLTAELTGLTYDNEFTSTPAMTGNTVTLNVPPGATQTAFVIEKKEGVLLDGDEKIILTLSSVGQDLVAGEKNSLVISFSEILAGQGAMDPNVGGQLQPKKVFVDLSANRQTAINRSDWDLGFYSADGEFRVILNSSSSMLARALDKNDLNDVTAADTTGWGNQLSADAIFAALTSGSPPAWLSDAIEWIDAPSGDMTTTAIEEISANDSDNKVYIINRGKNPDGSSRGWKKIRVVRAGDNYTLQHADISATSFNSVEVERDDDYLFNYLKFETGAVVVEPAKEKWDIAFTVFTNSTPAGPGLTVPYVFNDIVIQNRFDTETAELLVADAGTYEEFDESDLTSVTFAASQINIGSKWRTGGGPSSPPALKEDRFYIIKDSAGNIYKLKFTALTQNGERGRPQFEYALVKEGV